jgi:hypothetical protein
MANAKDLLESRFVLSAALADLTIETSYAECTGRSTYGATAKAEGRQVPTPARRQGSRRASQENPVFATSGSAG